MGPVRAPLDPQLGPGAFRRSALARVLLSLLGWKLVFEGLPSRQGVVIVYPHTSNWDFVFLILAKWSAGIPVRFWGKDSLFKWPVLGLGCAGWEAFQCAGIRPMVRSARWHVPWLRARQRLIFSGSAWRRKVPANGCPAGAAGFIGWPWKRRCHWGFVVLIFGKNNSGDRLFGLVW